MVIQMNKPEHAAHNQMQKMEQIPTNIVLCVEALIRKYRIPRNIEFHNRRINIFVNDLQPYQNTNEDSSTPT